MSEQGPITLEEIADNEAYRKHLAWLITDGPIRDQATITGCWAELDLLATDTEAAGEALSSDGSA